MSPSTSLTWRDVLVASAVAVPRVCFPRTSAQQPTVEKFGPSASEVLVDLRPRIAATLFSAERRAAFKSLRPAG